MAKKNKGKPPSRIKYEAEHPTISCRVSREIYEQLINIKATEGKSFSDILKVGLSILEVKIDKESHVFQRAYANGYEDRHRDGEAKYKVAYCCFGCGSLIDVDTEEEKEAAADYMMQNKWGHSFCLKRT